MAEIPETANHKFWLEDGAVRSRPASAAEIDQARESFTMAFRSCWECNAAHERFLDGPEGHSFMCHACGRYFSNGIDVGDYSDLLGGQKQ